MSTNGCSPRRITDTCQWCGIYHEPGRCDAARDWQQADTMSDYKTLDTPSPPSLDRLFEVRLQKLEETTAARMKVLEEKAGVKTVTHSHTTFIGTKFTCGACKGTWAIYDKHNIPTGNVGCPRCYAIGNSQSEQETSK